MRNALERLALGAFALPIRILPRRAALALGAGIGRLGWASGVRRRLVLANIGQAFPQSTAAERSRIARAAAANIGRTFTEFLRFAGRDRRRVAELVAIEPEGLAALREELDAGRGALVVTAHLGAWALYVTALAAVGVPSALLVGKQRNPYVDRMILGIPGDAVRFVSKGKTAPRGILESLGEGRAVVMVADHYISAEAVWAPFLGRVASTLPLPGAILAKRPELALFLITGAREERGRHRVVLRRLRLDPELAGDELRLAVATLCNRELGDAILARPEQYFWYHDRWKRRGSGESGKKVLGEPPPASAAVAGGPAEGETP